MKTTIPAPYFSCFNSTFYQVHNIWYPEPGSGHFTHLFTQTLTQTMSKQNESSLHNFDTFREEQLDFNTKIQNEVAHLAEGLYEIKKMLEECFKRNPAKGKESVEILPPP